MRTKFIKVSTADRPPEKRDYFHTDKGQLTFLPFAGWYRGCMKVGDPDYWLLEVPDYEEEMKEMLEKSLDFIEEISMLIPANWPEKFRDHYNRKTLEIEELLTKLKTES
jgi:hypothetical protein